MHVAVGLGNPGKRFEGTRHNLGFEVIDRLAELLGVAHWETRFDASIARGQVDGHRFILAKPLTYMNKSGWSVRALLQFYKLPLADALMIVDDLDLSAGKVRARDMGSDGGHLGLRSVIECMGSQDFKRIRLGVGRPLPGESVIGRVLDKVTGPEEAELLSTAVECAARLAEEFIVQGKFENWTSP